MRRSAAVRGHVLIKCHEMESKLIMWKSLYTHARRFSTFAENVSATFPHMSNMPDFFFFNKYLNLVEADVMSSVSLQNYNM